MRHKGVASQKPEEKVRTPINWRPQDSGWRNNGDNRLCLYRTRDLETTDCAGHSQSPKTHFWRVLITKNWSCIGCRLITSSPPSHYILIKHSTTNHEEMIRSPCRKSGQEVCGFHIDSVFSRGQLQVFCNVYSQLPPTQSHEQRLLSEYLHCY